MVLIQFRVEVRTAAACAVKELVLNHYESKPGIFCLHEEDKLAFKSSIFYMFNQLMDIRVLR